MFKKLFYFVLLVLFATPALAQMRPGDCIQKQGAVFQYSEKMVYYPSKIDTIETFKGTEFVEVETVVSDTYTDWNDKGCLIEVAPEKKVVQVPVQWREVRVRIYDSSPATVQYKQVKYPARTIVTNCE